MKNANKHVVTWWLIAMAVYAIAVLGWALASYLPRK